MSVTIAKVRVPDGALPGDALLVNVPGAIAGPLTVPADAGPAPAAAPAAAADDDWGTVSLGMSSVAPAPAPAPAADDGDDDWGSASFGMSTAAPGHRTTVIAFACPDCRASPQPAERLRQFQQFAEFEPETPTRACVAGNERTFICTADPDTVPGAGAAKKIYEREKSGEQVPLNENLASDVMANSTGRMLLRKAVNSGRRDIVSFLLSRGLDIDDERFGPTLHKAVWSGKYLWAVRLIDMGADIEARLNQVSPPDRTPLMRGADRARSCPAERVPVQLALLRLLLSRGASLRAKDRYGHTAIQIAGLGTPARAFLSDVKAAGGWRSYVHRDRRRLLVLRVLCEKGRASTSDGLLARLFPPQASDDDATVDAPAALDRDAFRHVLSFWQPVPQPPDDDSGENST